MSRTVEDVAGEKYKRSVNVNSSGDDSLFLILNSASSNGSFRYCDMSGELVYAFDISNMQNASFSLAVCQNYYVEVSDNGYDWVEIADYSEGGTVERIKSGSNRTNLIIDPDEFGFTDIMYIHIRNTDSTQGFGGALSLIEWTYQAKADKTFLM